MENSEKPIISGEFVSSDGKKIYKAGVYNRHEDCNCRGFITHKKCKHTKELLEKLKNNKTHEKNK